MTTKICAKCEQTKNLEDFNKRSISLDGYNPWCRTCLNAYRKERRDNRREAGLPQENKAWQQANRGKLNAARTAKRKETRDFIRSLKIGRPCDICGGVFPPVAMDWDHIDPALKSFEICQEGIREMYSQERLLEEIAKCRLLCANCHRVHSASQRGEDPREWA